MINYILSHSQIRMQEIIITSKWTNVHMTETQVYAGSLKPTFS